MPLEIFQESLTASTVTQRTVVNLSDVITEGSTSEYDLELKVAGGGTLDNTDLVSAELTLYDEETKSVINDRFNQDILGTMSLGANNVEITTVSKVIWSMQAEDNVIKDPTKTKRLEWHRAIFKVVYDTGPGEETFIHEVRFPVKPGFHPE